METRRGCLDSKGGELKHHRAVQGPSPLSVEAKIFFSIVARRMTEFLLRNNFTGTSAQKGGVPKVPGCIEHTGVVTQLIREARGGKGDLAVLGLQLANAYGSIPHKLVETSLDQSHIPGKIRDLMLDYYSCFSESHSNSYISLA